MSPGIKHREKETPITNLKMQPKFHSDDRYDEDEEKLMNNEMLLEVYDGNHPNHPDNKSKKKRVKTAKKRTPAAGTGKFLNKD